MSREFCNQVFHPVYGYSRDCQVILAVRIGQSRFFFFSEVSELFHESIADLMDEEDSEELDDAMEITNVIKECERVVEVRNNLLIM